MLHVLGLLRAVAIALCLLAGIGVAQAAPALWVVQSGQSTVYLFGTVHMLKPGLAWRTEALNRALTDSREVWLEIGEIDPPSIQALTLQYGLDPGHPLSTRLPAPLLARLKAVVGTSPLGMKALDPMRPWLAAVAVGVLPILKAGYRPDQGADDVIRAAAKAAAKPVRGLETMEGQIRLLADLPEAVQEEFLASAVDEQNPADIDGLVKAWTAGDEAGIDGYANVIRREAPALYRRVLVDRNKAFTDRIVRLTTQPGTVLVAVGAEHLVGPDGVPTMLAARGIAAHRIDGAAPARP